MAGGDIYLSEMLKSLNANIDALKTDMATMSGDMASMVTELVNVKNAVTSGISMLPVSAGGAQSVVLTTVDKSKEYVLNAPLVAAKFVCFCSGGLEFKGMVKSSHAAPNNAVLYYRVNGGAWVQMISQGGTTYTAVSYSLSVVANDVVEIGINGSGGGVTGYLQAGASVDYDIVDVVNDGAVVVV